ncbi:MAG: hypothetical protein E7565_02155 [Ruminococcaceae bacterium]|nr:hypothetical protein [Oscillospiraceae bacterium]
MKKLLALVLCVCMMFSLSLGVSAYTINKDDAEIGADDIFGATAVYFEDVEVTKNGDVTVDLMLESNPGVTEVKVTLALPEGIAVKTVANGDMGAATVSGNVITVVNNDGFILDGCIAKVTFTATSGGEKKVTLTATAKNGEDAINVNGSECVINVVAPAVTVVLGDVNGDGAVDTTDLAELKLYLAGLQTEVSEGADMDEDGSVDTTDLAMLKLLLAGF